MQHHASAVPTPWPLPSQPDDLPPPAGTVRERGERERERERGGGRERESHTIVPNADTATTAPGATPGGHVM